jgi:hypothetical protein
MNRGEAINQLNLERKRRENDVWEKWFLTETRGEVTSSRLLDRTNELNKIRDNYDKTLQRLNEQPAEQVEQNPQRIPRSVNRPTNTVPRVRPGTENLPENQPLVPGQEVRPQSQSTQVNNESEPRVVRLAREENIRIESETDFPEEALLDYPSDGSEPQIQETLKRIKKTLVENDIAPEEFFSSLPGSDEVSKLQSIIRESKNVSYVFPVFTLATAALIDMIEWINALPAAGFITLIILSIIKYGALVPIIWISTFGGTGFITRSLVRKFINGLIFKRWYFLILSPLAEFIPILGSFWPGTLLFVFWLLNAKTVAGRILLELAKIAQKDSAIS